MNEKTNEIASLHLELLDAVVDKLHTMIITIRQDLRKFESLGGDGHTLLGDMRNQFADTLARLDKLRADRTEPAKEARR